MTINLQQIRAHISLVIMRGVDRGRSALAIVGQICFGVVRLVTLPFALTTLLVIVPVTAGAKKVNALVNELWGMLNYLHREYVVGEDSIASAEEAIKAQLAVIAQDVSHAARDEQLASS